MSDYRPVHVTKKQAEAMGIQTFSEASKEVSEKEAKQPGYARMPEKWKRANKPEVVKPPKRGKGRRKKLFKKRGGRPHNYPKEAHKTITGVLKHVTASPEERAAAVRRKRRL